MGGRIHVLLGAWAYAQRTERTLVVDWSDGCYGNDTDAFQTFFTNPFLKFSRFREIVGVANESRSPPPPPPPRILPAVWQAKFADIGLQNPSSLYRCSPPQDDVPEDIVIVSWPVPGQEPDELTKLACRLGLSSGIQARVKELCSQFDTDSAIGIHYRHGNGERAVFAPQPEWFEQTVTELDPSNSRPLYFCTDSTFAEQHFRQIFGPRFHSSNKLFPERGSLHDNPAIQDKVRNGEDALADLYTLAKCSDFIDTGNFYSKTARLLGAGRRGKCLRYTGIVRKRNPGARDFFAKLQPVADNAELATALEAAGIRLDNLWFDRDGLQLKLYYGMDLLLDVPVQQLEKSMPRLIEQLQRRRLYV